MTIRQVPAALKEAVRDFFDDDALRHGAALSYYAVLSVAPLLLLLLAIGGLFFEKQRVAEALVGEMRGLIGEAGAEVATTVVQHAQQGQSALAAVIGLIVLIFAASGVFVQLQDTMNAIWEVKSVPGKGIWGFLRKRLLSIGILLALAFLLITSLAVSAGLTAFNSYFLANLPGADVLWKAVYTLISIGIFTALFAALFKFLPDVKISWRNVWMGALFTAVLFTIGKLLIGLYLGRSTVGAAYGAAGSLILLLVWVFYSALIVLFGAEFTQVHAHRSGAEIKPSRSAVWRSETRPAGQAQENGRD